ncbi:sulfatase [Mucilaginibacter sp. HC2]|uniref:sulfatase family protein n=1 Tax=Mucilaginibacter inviolabilis TaxID=2714892 RepID=UPI00140B1F0D|nr:sulfatase [Mucilaginibacter inviolabilis]NHA05356.1 sulfatase [Mucilaginibacter inviolabilis]
MISVKVKFKVKAISFITAIILSTAFSIRAYAQQENPTRPNIIFIMSDDHASAAISAYNKTLIHTPNLDRIGNEGIVFKNCFVTNSLCSPSRASILTGMYSHLTGARDNSFSMRMKDDVVTFPMLLQKAGYQTAILGKWHLLNEPKGFNYYSVLHDQGEYYNPDFTTNGVADHEHGYVTNIIMDKALQWLSETQKNGKPFCLMIHNKAPHRNWIPDTSDLNEFKKDLPLPASLYDDYSGRGTAAHKQEMSIAKNMTILSDLKVGASAKNSKGAWSINEFNRMDSAQRNQLIRFYAQEDQKADTSKMTRKEYIAWKYQRYIKDYLRCIKSIDENVGRLLSYLKKSGLMDNTIIVYTSDQGFYLGEHGWFDKRFMYEESLHTPLMIRYPPLIKAGLVNSAMVSNLDLPSTFLNMAGVNIPPSMQGRSLKPLLENKTPANWRTAVYYHFYEYPGVHAVKRHYGIRTRDYKLIHFYYDINEWELYDLKKDPHEMRNVYDMPQYEAVKNSLTKQLAQLRSQYGDSDQLTEEILEHDKNILKQHQNK